MVPKAYQSRQGGSERSSVGSSSWPSSGCSVQRRGSPGSMSANLSDRWRLGVRRPDPVCHPKPARIGGILATSPPPWAAMMEHGSVIAEANMDSHANERQRCGGSWCSDREVIATESSRSDGSSEVYIWGKAKAERELRRTPWQLVLWRATGRSTVVPRDIGMALDKIWAKYPLNLHGNRSEFSQFFENLRESLICHIAEQHR
jgi:hypothetical protein